MYFFKSIKQVAAFAALGRERRRLVFYSEGRSSWPHLEPLIDELVHEHGATVCYVSSSDDDPGLTYNSPLLLRFNIGAGAARTYFFANLDCDVLAMTMPDLHTFHIKRSRYPVHYAYIHHSLVSTHMVYRQEAFDHFDTIFCAGPHHVSETQEAEKIRSLPPKSYIEHGYGRLDRIILNAKSRRLPVRSDHVLVAPSWGQYGLLETCGAQLVGILLEAGYVVTVRPHPETARRSPAALDGLRSCFSGHAAFKIETDIVSHASFAEAGLMISDWSGAALEYAFGYERPVLFVDVPRKISNPNYTRLKSPPIEVSIREEIGTILPANHLSDTARHVKALTTECDARSTTLRAARNRWVFNVGVSARHGADVLLTLVATQVARRTGESG